MDTINPAGKAKSTQYAPTNPSDWSPPPTNVGQALDQLAAEEKEPDPATSVAYNPAQPSDWSPPPTQVAQALDQLAATHNDAATTNYTPAFPVDWNPVPTHVAPALDQLAEVVRSTDQAAATSTNTIPIQLYRRTLDPSEVMTFRATVAAERFGVSQVGKFVREFTVKRVGFGPAILVQDLVPSPDYQEDPGLAVTAGVDSSSATIMVTGLAGTVDWYAVIQLVAAT